MGGVFISRTLRGIALFLVLGGLQPGLHAQLRNSNWAFGQDNGVSFTSGGAAVPSFLQPETSIGGPCASLSDALGNALIYAAGQTVYNSDFEVMSNSPDMDYAASAQGFLFLPKPGDPDRIVMFHNSAEPFQSILSYAYVDPELENGSGSFTSGMSPLTGEAARKLTAVAHANGQDYWVLSQLWGTDAIAAYSLDENGVDTMPVISHTGVPLSMSVDGIEQALGWGSLVVSPAGDRLALVASLPNAIEPYDLEHAFVEILAFDPATGIAVHVATIPPPEGITIDGLEFSPDGSKLYGSTTSYVGSVHYDIHQYDLSILEEISIVASDTVVFTGTFVGNFYDPDLQLALAPDGRIWFHTGMFSPWLGVIGAPNEAGMACMPIGEYLLLPNNAGGGLPNQCKRYHDSDLNTGAIPEPVMGGLMVWPNPVQNELYINAPNPGCTSWLYDATGRLVRAVTAGQRRTAIMDVEGLPAGPYLLRCADEEGHSWLSRVVKE